MTKWRPLIGQCPGHVTRPRTVIGRGRVQSRRAPALLLHPNIRTANILQLGEFTTSLFPQIFNSFVLLSVECPGIGHEDTNASIGEHFVMRKGEYLCSELEGERDICQEREGGLGPLTPSAGNLCFRQAGYAPPFAVRVVRYTVNIQFSNTVNVQFSTLFQTYIFASADFKRRFFLISC